MQKSFLILWAVMLVLGACQRDCDYKSYDTTGGIYHLPADMEKHIEQRRLRNEKYAELHSYESKFGDPD